ncbi:ABC transporter permease [Candidatus Cloacimonadota bacterium]
MIKFLTLGLLRDRSRSLFPILIIAAGVMITVVVFCWIQGAMEMFLFENARLETGHVKVVTRAYNEMIDQKPFDLGFLDLDNIMTELRAEYPDMIWLPRTTFGGLLDTPDEDGETISQGEVFCLGIDLFNSSTERELLKLDEAITAGRLPEKNGEIIISSEVAEKMNINLNDTVTIITSTIYGSMTFKNYVVTGTVKFGVKMIDKGAVFLDISDMQYLLDMENGSAEILGFFPDNNFDQEKANAMKKDYNEKYSDPVDEFSPYMLTLMDQNSMGYMVNSMETRLGLMVFIFVFIMSLVLWNSGLMNGIRRYGEVGVRLAIGEDKLHVYLTMIIESLFVALTGSVLGTAIGLLISFFLQEHGIDVSSMMENVTMISSTIMRARITPEAFFIGFIPGILASILGALFSGVGIFKRDTAQLFKELET